MALVLTPVILLLQLYSYVILIRILLTWFPNVDWWAEPYATIRKITDPYLEIFRKVVPPIGMLDISPIFAMLLLQVIIMTLRAMARM